MFKKHKNILIVFGSLSIVTLSLFWPFFFKGYIPFPGPYMLSWYEPWKSIYSTGGVPSLVHKPVIDDAFRHLYPLRVVASNFIKQGQLPLWNPYNGAGTPLLAIMHPGYLTPFGIFFLFLPPAIGWSIYIMLQPLVLGMATYWYVTRLKLSPRAAFFSSLVLLLSGFAVVRLEYGEFLYVLAGLPILLGIVEAWRTKPKYYSVLTIPFVVALMMFSGQPHMIVYALLVFALYTLIRVPLKTAIFFGSLSFLGVGLAGIQLIPALELYQHSTISQESSAFIFDRFLLPLSHLVTLVIPNYFGNQATYNYFGPHDYTETVAYIGSIPVFLAVLVLWKRIREPVVLFFGLLSVGAILTTIQWVGARMFFTLPIPILSSDVPSRIFVLSTFGISILSGYGVSLWERIQKKEARRILMIAAVVMGICLGVTSLIYGMKIPCPVVQIPQCRLISLRTSLLEALVFFTFLLGALVLRKKFIWLCFASVLAIGLYNGLKFLPFSPPAMVFPSAPVIRELQKVSGLDRYAAVDSGAIRTNLMTYFGLYNVEYFDPLHIRRYAELVSFANTGSKTEGVTRSDVLVEDSPRRNRFFDITSTRYLVESQNKIHERSTALPRMYMVYTYEIIPDDEKLLQRLFDPSIDIQNTVLLEKEMTFFVQEGIRLPVSIENYTGVKVDAAVTTDQDGILVLTDTWYPGWKAFIDGKETPIFRANYAFRAIMVSKGSHTIVFSYEPMSLRLGAEISLVSFIIVLLVQLSWRWSNPDASRDGRVQ